MDSKIKILHHTLRFFKSYKYVRSKVADSSLGIRLVVRQALATVFLIQFTTVKLANKMPAAYLHGAAKRKFVRTDAMLVKETDINHRIYDKFVKSYYYLKRKTRLANKLVAPRKVRSLIGNLEN